MTKGTPASTVDILSVFRSCKTAFKGKALLSVRDPIGCYFHYVKGLLSVLDVTDGSDRTVACLKSVLHLSEDKGQV